MFVNKTRHCGLFKAVAITLTCLFLLNDIALAAPDVLAPQSGSSEAYTRLLRATQLWTLHNDSAIDPFIISHLKSLYPLLKKIDPVLGFTDERIAIRRALDQAVRNSGAIGTLQRLEKDRKVQIQLLVLEDGEALPVFQGEEVRGHASDKYITVFLKKNELSNIKFIVGRIFHEIRARSHRPNQSFRKFERVNRRLEADVAAHRQILNPALKAEFCRLTFPEHLDVRNRDYASTQGPRPGSPQPAEIKTEPVKGSGDELITAICSKINGCGFTFDRDIFRGFAEKIVKKMTNKQPLAKCWHGKGIKVHIDNSRTTLFYFDKDGEGNPIMGISLKAFQKFHSAWSGERKRLEKYPDVWDEQEHKFEKFPTLGLAELLVAIAVFNDGRQWLAEPERKDALLQDDAHMIAELVREFEEDPAWVERGRMLRVMARSLQSDEVLGDFTKNLSAELGLGPGTVIRGGRYELVEKVGAGGFGVVYAAWDHNVLYNLVAIKQIKNWQSLDNKARNRLMREIACMASVNSPSVVTVTDVIWSQREGEEDRPEFLIEKYAKGPTLHYLLRHDLLSEEQKILIAIECLKGLEVLHNKDIVHRDIKPGNIAVDVDIDKKTRKIIIDKDTGKVKKIKSIVILDLGFAKNLKDKKEKVESADATQELESFGTPEYMSPEQATDAKNVTAATDVYAMGMMFYKMFTGKSAVNPKNEEVPPFELMVRQTAAHYERPSVHNPNIHPMLEAIILKAIDRNLSVRYKNATELLAAMEEFLRELKKKPLLQPEEGIQPTIAFEKTPQPSVQKRPLAGKDRSLAAEAAPAAGKVKPSVRRPAKGRDIGKIIAASSAIFATIVGVIIWCVAGRKPAPKPAPGPQQDESGITQKEEMPIAPAVVPAQAIAQPTIETIRLVQADKNGGGSVHLKLAENVRTGRGEGNEYKAKSFEPGESRPAGGRADCFVEVVGATSEKGKNASLKIVGLEIPVIPGKRYVIEFDVQKTGSEDQLVFARPLFFDPGGKNLGPEDYVLKIEEQGIWVRGRMPFTALSQKLVGVHLYFKRGVCKIGGEITLSKDDGSVKTGLIQAKTEAPTAAPAAGTLRLFDVQPTGDTSEPYKLKNVKFMEGPGLKYDVEMDDGQPVVSIVNSFDDYAKVARLGVNRQKLREMDIEPGKKYKITLRVRLDDIKISSIYGSAGFFVPGAEDEKPFLTGQVKLTGAKGEIVQIQLVFKAPDQIIERDNFKIYNLLICFRPGGYTIIGSPVFSPASESDETGLVEAQSKVPAAAAPVAPTPVSVPTLPAQASNGAIQLLHAKPTNEKTEDGHIRYALDKNFGLGSGSQGKIEAIGFSTDDKRPQAAGPDFYLAIQNPTDKDFNSGRFNITGLQPLAEGIKEGNAYKIGFCFRNISAKNPIFRVILSFIKSDGQQNIVSAEVKCDANSDGWMSGQYALVAPAGRLQYIGFEFSGGTWSFYNPMFEPADPSEPKGATTASLIQTAPATTAPAQTQGEMVPFFDANSRIAPKPECDVKVENFAPGDVPIDPQTGKPIMEAKCFVNMSCPAGEDMQTTAFHIEDLSSVIKVRKGERYKVEFCLELTEGTGKDEFRGYVGVGFRGPDRKSLSDSEGINFFNFPAGRKLVRVRCVVTAPSDEIRYVSPNIHRGTEDRKFRMYDFRFGPAGALETTGIVGMDGATVLNTRLMGGNGSEMRAELAGNGYLFRITSPSGDPAQIGRLRIHEVPPGSEPVKGTPYMAEFDLRPVQVEKGDRKISFIPRFDVDGKDVYLSGEVRPSDFPDTTAEEWLRVRLVTPSALADKLIKKTAAYISFGKGVWEVRPGSIKIGPVGAGEKTSVTRAPVPSAKTSWYLKTQQQLLWALDDRVRVWTQDYLRREEENGSDAYAYLSYTPQDALPLDLLPPAAMPVTAKPGAADMAMSMTARSGITEPGEMDKTAPYIRDKIWEAGGKYNFILPFEFFAKDEFDLHRIRYEKKLNFERVGGMMGDMDDFIDRVLDKVRADEEGRTVALIPHTGALTEKHLTELQKAGVKFVLMDMNDIIAIGDTQDEEKRLRLQERIYDTMLFFRYFDEVTAQDPIVASGASFYLRQAFAFKGMMTMAAYIEAMKRGNIAELINGWLSYKKLERLDEALEAGHLTRSYSLIFA